MPNKNPCRRDILAKDRFCVLANILVIIPPYNYSAKDEACRKQCWYRWYGIAIFVVLIFGNALSICGRFKDAYPNLPTYTLVTTDMGLIISIILMNVFTVLMPSFLNVENFNTFMEIFSKTDKFLIPVLYSCENIKICKYFYIELVVGHLVLFIIAVYDGYVWINGLGFIHYRNYIFQSFQIYHVFVTVMVMHNFALSMKCRFKALNRTLEEMVNLPGVDNEDSKLCLQSDECEFHHTIRQISQAYKRQIMQVNLFNRVFGWQILFLMLAIIMGLLNALDIITVFIFMEDAFEKSLEIDLIVLNSLISIWILIMGVLVTVSCNRTSNEAQRMADICYGILLSLPPIPETKQDRAFRDELILLSQMVLNRCPSFSAVGFFSIDYHLLLAIFGCVTSYVIVLIQFNK